MQTREVTSLINAGGFVFFQTYVQEVLLYQNAQNLAKLYTMRAMIEFSVSNTKYLPTLKVW